MDIKGLAESTTIKKLEADVAHLLRCLSAQNLTTKEVFEKLEALEGKQAPVESEPVVDTSLLIKAYSEYQQEALAVWAALGKTIDWSEVGQPKYLAVWCHVFKKWCVPRPTCTSTNPFAVYFPTKDTAMLVTKKIDAKYEGVLR